MASIKEMFSIILPKGKPRAGGISATPTYNPGSANAILSIPAYRDHMSDIFTTRVSDDSRALMQSLFKMDPDVSATVNVFLTLANTQMTILVRDLDGQIDRDAIKTLNNLIIPLVRATDYTQGFSFKSSLLTMCANLRYMLLLRGAIPVELIYDKILNPSELRIIDAMTLQWNEKEPGKYKPQQTPKGGSPYPLDTPQFFISFYRRDPTGIYSDSPFVAAINTIAARQQVVNDLYRIMQVTGFPRLDITVMEDVLRRSAPASVQQDEQEMRKYINQRLNEVRTGFENIRADQAMVHPDSVTAKVINEKNPASALNISDVINVLNSQNQAALKTMATVIGRGADNASTASVEARIAAMNADELNVPLSELLSNVFSYMLHQIGYQGFAEVIFKRVELRPELELEPQLTLRQSRLLADLSEGLITDDEYHLMMYSRIRPDSTPILSGTKFYNSGGGIDAAKMSPNSDPLGKSLSPEGSKAARSSSVTGKKPK